MPALLAKNLRAFLHLTEGVTVELALRYTLFAGVAWLLGYVFFHRRWFHRKIIARMPQSSDVWREARYSALSVAVFSIVAAITLVAIKHGWTQMYWRIDKRGWLWFCLSIAAAVFLHDAYFYWTHRLMHHPRLFRVFHRAHHLSRNPSPWASYAFSAPEALVQVAIFPMTIMLIPIHPVAFGIYTIWQILFNVVGHTGYEYSPAGLMDSWLGYFLNTPTNHVMHHEKMRGNYGLYFNFWDRLMGTNHEDYERRFREITARRQPSAQPEPVAQNVTPASLP
jgi:sterol desaturase/sphingolipid hydroxylase (fatty acid hydroxylase superfamily)